MNKFGFFAVFIIVLSVHLIILQSQAPRQSTVSKPDTKVHRITLSAVVVQKPPQPKIEPIILPPDPKPIVKPKPVEKPKPKRKKKSKRAKRVKPKVIPEPVHEIAAEVPELIVEQVISPVARIDTSSIRDRYTSLIRKEIRKQLYYPKMAKRLRMQDIVQVAFRVHVDGSISSIQLLNNPKKLLGNGAIKTLHALSLPPIPSELDTPYLDISIPIEFKLKKG